MGPGGNSESNAGSSKQVVVSDDSNPEVLVVQGSSGNEDKNKEGSAAHSVPKKRRRGRTPRPLPPEVPKHIRDRIKALLTLKYMEGGCALFHLAERYEEFYHEELNPRHYGFEDKRSMLKSFPKEELTMKIVRGDPRVYGREPLKKTDRIEALRKIFDPAGQPNIPWRKDEPVIPLSDEGLWNDQFLEEILQGANPSSLVGDSNEGLSVTNPVEVSVSPKANEISAGSMSQQTETITAEANSGLPDSTKESLPVTLELADADTSNAPGVEQPGTSRSSGAPQPPAEPEPEVSIIVEDPKPQEIVECITIEDSDEEEEEGGEKSKDRTPVTSKFPSVLPVILPKTEARPNAQVCNRSQILANFVESLQKKGQKGTASNQTPPNNLASKCNNQVSAASSKDTSATKESSSSQVNTRSKRALLSNPVHAHAETVRNDPERPSAGSTRDCRSRATTPKKNQESNVQKSSAGTIPLVPVVEEGPLDLRKEPEDLRKEPVGVRKEPVGVRKEPAGLTEESVDLTEEPVDLRKDPVAPRKDPVAPRKDPVAPRKDPVAPRKDPVDLNKGPEDPKKSGPTAAIQPQSPSPEPNSPVGQVPPIQTPEGYKCRITPEEFNRCMSMFVRLKRLEDCEPRKSSPRKRKISEISVISSDNDPTNKLDTRRKSPRLASKKPPTVSDLCKVPSRPDQCWFTTNFREDIDGIEASTYKDLMQYTEILRPPEIVESEDYFSKFTKTYYFMYKDKVKSDLKRLEEAAKEWNNEMYQGFFLNPFASFLVEYSVSASETEIIVDPEQNIKIPMMNYEAIQMANLDADANICDIAGRSEQTIVLTSYGNYADYFLWKWGKNCQCVGLLPAKSKDLAKFKRAGGVSYDNFYLHDECASNVFEPEMLDGFIRSMKDVYPSLADLFVANGIGWTGMKQRPQDLALVQCFLALALVRHRGSFILKLNDTFTCFTAGLLFYLSRCFGYLTMIKPVSSLPGERFVICRDKHSEARCQLVKNYLRTCYNKTVENQWLVTNLYLDKIFGSKDGSPTSSRLTEVDNEFLLCLKKWNSGIAKVELDEYDSFCVIRQFWTESSPETRLSWQDNLKIVRGDFLEAWNLTLNQSCEPEPLETVTSQVNSGPTISSILENLNLVEEKTIGTVDLSAIAGNLTDWKFLLSASPVCRHVFHATDAGTSKWDGSWIAMDELKLPSGTFLYGEIFPASKSRPAFLSVLDVKQWGKEIMDDKPYHERIRLVQEKAKDMPKVGVVITFSDAFNIDDVPMVLNKLSQNNKFTKSYFKGFDDSSASTTKNSNASLNIIVGGLVFVPIKKALEGCSENLDFSHLVSQRLLWTLSSPLSLADAAETLYTVIRNRGSSSSSHPRNTHLSNFAQFVYGLKNLK